jgi:hypothetical protein
MVFLHSLIPGRELSVVRINMWMDTMKMTGAAQVQALILRIRILHDLLLNNVQYHSGFFGYPATEYH